MEDFPVTNSVISKPSDINKNSDSFSQKYYLLCCKMFVKQVLVGDGCGNLSKLVTLTYS